MATQKETSSDVTDQIPHEKENDMTIDNVNEDTNKENKNNGINGVDNEGFEGQNKAQTEDVNTCAYEGLGDVKGEGHINYSMDIKEDDNETREKGKDSDEKGDSKKTKTKKEDEENTGSTSYAPVGSEKDEGSHSSWISWLKKELKWNKKLIPIKIIQFLYSGGTNSMLPYLTLHMKELGLSIGQIGWIYAFLPITTILGPPISGMVADRTGNYKAVVLVNMILTTALHLALLYLPGEGVNKLTLHCGNNYNQTTLEWDTCKDCHDLYGGMNFSVTLKNCEYLCPHVPSSPFELCFNGGGNGTDICQKHNITDTININGTVAATRTEDGVCGHTWNRILFKNHLEYSGLSCPSERCQVECEVGGAPSCLSVDGEAPGNVFWPYFFVRIIGNFFLSSLFTMMDAMTIAIVKDHGGDYGKQRLLFIIGMATVPLAAGFLNDWDAGSNGTSFYLPALYLGSVLCLASAILIARLTFQVEMAKGNIFGDLRKLVTRPEICVYFIVILVLGSNWGFIESYLFLYMGQLGSPNYIMGLTMTVGSVLGMPTMLVADPVIKIVGRHNIFIVSFFAYALRHFGYSFISSPWMVFPFEVLEVFTYQLMWVAAITYCPVLAPPGLLATMTGVAGAVHFSMGRGVGSFVGGQLMTNLDFPGAFRCYGAIALVSGVLYILLHLFYFKKKIAKREKELKQSDKINNGLEMTDRS